MKKIFLSAFVIMSFAAYALSKRVDVDGAPSFLGNTNSASIQEQSNSSITPTPTNTPTLPQNSGAYHNGQYKGSVADAYYGNVQVRVTVAGGKISDITFLDYPRERPTSIQISQYAIPILRSEAIQSQSADVDIVSGATLTSEAFIRSLSSALSQAKNNP